MTVAKTSPRSTTRPPSTSSIPATSTLRTQCLTKTMTNVCASSSALAYNHTQSTPAKWRRPNLVMPGLVQTQQHQIPGHRRAQAAVTIEAETIGSTPEKSDSADILTMSLGFQSALRAKIEGRDTITSTPTSTTNVSGLQRSHALLHREPGAAVGVPTNLSRNQSRSPLRDSRPTWRDASLALTVRNG